MFHATYHEPKYLKSTHAVNLVYSNGMYNNRPSSLEPRTKPNKKKWATLRNCFILKAEVLFTVPEIISLKTSTLVSRVILRKISFKKEK